MTEGHTTGGQGLIGRSVPAQEAPRLLSGAGRFVDDVRLPGMLVSTFVRSIHAHARITSIDTGAARAWPGVQAVITAADLGPLARPLPPLFEQPGFTDPRTHVALASDMVRYIGEPIVFVVATSRYVAEDAAAMVEIEYDALPAIASIEAALAPDAPLVHADVPRNLAGSAGFRVGDIDAALAGAAHVLELDLRMDRGAAVPIEGRGLVAQWDPALGMTIWASTQRPVKLRNALAMLLGIEAARVRVIAGDIGGGFGPKGMFTYPEEVVVPWAARHLGRPVKWIEDRLEHMVATTHSREQRHHVTVGIDADGRLLGLRDRFVNDGGAYVPYGLSVPGYTAATIPGPYRLPAYDVEWQVSYSNRTPTSPYRGSGGPYAVFVMERVMDRIAATLGLDRAEVRRRNLIAPDAMPYDPGFPFADGRPIVHEAGDYRAVLAQALQAIDWHGFPARRDAARRDGRHLGIGIACYVEATGLRSFEGARVSVEPTGRVVVRTGTSSQGQGHQTTIAQIVAQTLGVDLGSVTVLEGDTDAFGWGRGTYGSKVAVVLGTAAHRAARAVRERALAAAGPLLGEPAGSLELAGGAVRVATEHARSVPLGELAGRLLSLAGGAPEPGAAPGLDATEYYAPERAAIALGVHAVELEVSEVGIVTILRYVAFNDSGVAINPAVVDGQIRGGIAQGIGGTLLEQLVYDESGALLNGNLVDYVLPRAADIPDLETHHIDIPSATNELGIKGAGEAGIFPVAALLTSAIEDALLLAADAPITQTPLLLHVLECLVASATRTEPAVAASA